MQPPDRLRCALPGGRSGDEGQRRVRRHRSGPLRRAHRLTGHNAVGRRAEELGLTFGKDELRDITKKIKALADAGPLSMEQLDSILREWVVA